MFETAAAGRDVVRSERFLLEIVAGPRAHEHRRLGDPVGPRTDQEAG